MQPVQRTPKAPSRQTKPAQCRCFNTGEIGLGQTDLQQLIAPCIVRRLAELRGDPLHLQELNVVRLLGVRVRLGWSWSEVRGRPRGEIRREVERMVTVEACDENVKVEGRRVRGEG